MRPTHTRQLRLKKPVFNTCFILLLVLFFTFSSCVKDKFTDIELSYNGAVALPLGTVGFTLAEALDGDTTLTVGDDNGISLIYRENNFFSLSAQKLLDDLTGSLDEHFSKTTNMGEVPIGDMDEQFDMPFSDLVDDFNNQALKQMLVQNNGSTITVPAFQEALLSEMQVPVFNDFSYLEIASGTMTLDITNQLFVDLQNLVVSVVDHASGQVIGTFHFSYLATGATEQAVVDLQGKSFSNDLKVVISSLNSPGSGGMPVQIDLSKKLQYDLQVRDVSIKAGKAVLQPGVLAEDELPFEFTTENGEKIFQLQLNSANVGYTLTSEAKTTVKVKLTFLAIFKNNNPVTHEITVSPNSPVSGDIDFTDTDWRLDLDNAQPYNRMKVRYEVRLDQATGSQVEFSDEDQVSINFTVNSLDVKEVTGYFGSREETISDGKLNPGFDFSLFASGSSPLFFDNPVLRLEVSNSFGIPLWADFNATAQGFYGTQVSLDPPKLAIGYPSLSQAGETVHSGFMLSKNNSNIIEMLSVYPSEINYSGVIALNPNSNLQTVNFIRSDSELRASAELDLPFRFRAENIIHRDTAQSLDLGLDEGLTIEDIDSATLKILYTNGMPLMTAIRIIALEANGQEAIVLDDVSLPAASVSSEGKVTADGQASGELFITLTPAQLRQLENAAENIYEVHFQTPNGGQSPAAMYTDYEVELKLGLMVKFDK